MPFQSEKQRRYLWANEPEIARDWADTYGSRIEKNDGGIMRTGFFTAGLAAGDDISPGTDTKTGTARDRSQQGDMTIRDYKPPAGSHHKDIHGPVDKVEIKKGSRKVSHLKTNEQKRNLVLSLRKLGLMKGWNPFSDVPEWAENMTEEEIEEVGIESLRGNI